MINQLPVTLYGIYQNLDVELEFKEKEEGSFLVIDLVKSILANSSNRTASPNSVTTIFIDALPANFVPTNSEVSKPMPSSSQTTKSTSSLLV